VPGVAYGPPLQADSDGVMSAIALLILDHSILILCRLDGDQLGAEHRSAFATGMYSATGPVEGDFVLPVPMAV
jgi:hypothetical protein